MRLIEGFGDAMVSTGCMKPVFRKEVYLVLISRVPTQLILIVPTLMRTTGSSAAQPTRRCNLTTKCSASYGFEDSNNQNSVSN